MSGLGRKIPDIPSEWGFWPDILFLRFCDSVDEHMIHYTLCGCRVSICDFGGFNNWQEVTTFVGLAHRRNDKIKYRIQ